MAPRTAEIEMVIIWPPELPQFRIVLIYQLYLSNVLQLLVLQYVLSKLNII